MSIKEEELDVMEVTVKHALNQEFPFFPSDGIVINHVHTIDHEALGVLRRLSERLLAIIGALPTLQRFVDMSTELDTHITELQGDVTNLTSVVDSAKALMTGLAQALADAIAAAQNAGATPEELQALTDLHAAITTNSQGLADAVAANTPTPPSPPTA